MKKEQLALKFWYCVLRYSIYVALKIQHIRWLHSSSQKQLSIVLKHFCYAQASFYFMTLCSFMCVTLLCQDYFSMVRLYQGVKLLSRLALLTLDRSCPSWYWLHGATKNKQISSSQCEYLNHKIIDNSNLTQLCLFNQTKSNCYLLCYFGCYMACKLFKNIFSLV